MKNRRKTAAEIRAMRESGRMLAQVLELLQQKIAAGMTTGELDQIARKELAALGGEPAFLGYKPEPGGSGFPGVLCVSVNDEIIHGVPSNDRVLQDGDLVGLDFGVRYNGMITDAAITVGVGKVSAEADRLITATQEALAAGVAAVHGGGRVGEISAAVQARLDRDQLGIVELFSGHGVGHELHEDPAIFNFGPASQGPRLQAGQTIAIEPMATLGSGEVVMSKDGWTIKTADGTLGAHFEHTVSVTEAGGEILTQL